MSVITTVDDIMSHTLANSTSDTDEWIVRKKVEHITCRTLEQQFRRQVVLNDGRVVEEAVPHCITTTTHDHQTLPVQFVNDNHISTSTSAKEALPSSRSRTDHFDEPDNLLGKYTICQEDREDKGEGHELKVIETSDAVNIKEIINTSQTIGEARSLGLVKSEDVDRVIKYGRSIHGLTSKPIMKEDKRKIERRIESHVMDETCSTDEIMEREKSRDQLKQVEMRTSELSEDVDQEEEEKEEGVIDKNKCVRIQKDFVVERVVDKETIHTTKDNERIVDHNENNLSKAAVANDNNLITKKQKEKKSRHDFGFGKHISKVHIYD